MPVITAVCPYCRVGKVRAPDRAVGLSVNCPRCRSSFTLSPSDEPEPAPPPKPAADTGPVAALVETRPQAAEPPAPVADTAPLPVAAPPVAVQEPALAPALVALIVAGVALAVSQVPLPFARVATAVLAGGGVLLGLFCLAFAERKRLVPALAAGANAVAVLLAVALPGWLGLGSWLPPPPPEDPNLVKAFARGTGEVAPAAGWVDAAAAVWGQDDVRVSVRSAAVGRVELSAAGGRKKWSKDAALQVTVRVTNGGVARKIDFAGWGTAHPPHLTDPAGRPLAPKAFEAGWEPPGQPRAAVPLFPGKAADQTLYFEPPPRGVEYLRLELPGAAFGGPDPVRFQIPRSMLSPAPALRPNPGGNP